MTTLFYSFCLMIRISYIIHAVSQKDEKFTEHRPSMKTGHHFALPVDLSSPTVSALECVDHTFQCVVFSVSPQDSSWNTYQCDKVPALVPILSHCS